MQIKLPVEFDISKLYFALQPAMVFIFFRDGHANSAQFRAHRAFLSVHRTMCRVSARRLVSELAMSFWDNGSDQAEGERGFLV